MMHKTSTECLHHQNSFKSITIRSGVLFAFAVAMFGLANTSIEKNYVISLILLFQAGFMFISFYRARKDVLNPDGLFVAVWLMCIALSQLRLSTEQNEWNMRVWFVIYGSMLFYLLGSKIVDLKSVRVVRIKGTSIFDIDQLKLRRSIVVLFIISFLSFAVEVAVAGYVPIFAKSMSAYTSFGISFIHYNTVAICVVVILSFYYMLLYGLDKLSIVLFMLGLGQIISIVSRQLLIFTIFGCVLIFHYTKKRLSIKIITLIAIALLAIFALMGALRSQSIDYLYAVAKIKNDVPKNYLMWPYLYFSMGFENLNNLISSNSVDFMYGRLSFEPIMALTRIKTLLKPTDLTAFHTIREFNVSTYLSSYYLDFGIVGTIIAPFIIGVFSKLIYLKRHLKPIYLFAYIFVAHNLIFAFFVNFYSNTSIIINIAYFGMIYLYSVKRVDRKSKVLRDKQVSTAFEGQTFRNRKQSVDIVLATYKPNVVYFKKLLESIDKQTYKNIQLIVRDDSADCHQYEIVCDLLSKHIKTLPYRIEKNEINLGSNKTFELLTREATGDYIAYCDQDDIWEPNKIEVLVNEFSKNNICLCYSDLSVIDQSDQMIASSFKRLHKRLVHISGEGLFKTLLMRNSVTGCAMIIKRSVAQASLPFPNEYFVHDHWLALYASSQDGSIGYVSKPLINYRIHDGNQIGATMLNGITNRKDYIEKKLYKEKEKYKMLLERFDEGSYDHDQIKWASRWIEDRIHFFETSNLKWFLRVISKLRVDWQIVLFEVTLRVLPSKMSEKLLNRVRK